MNNNNPREGNVGSRSNSNKSGNQPTITNYNDRHINDTLTTTTNTTDDNSNSNNNAILLRNAFIPPRSTTATTSSSSSSTSSRSRNYYYNKHMKEHEQQQQQEQQLYSSKANDTTMMMIGLEYHQQQQQEHDSVVKAAYKAASDQLQQVHQQPSQSPSTRTTVSSSSKIRKPQLFKKSSTSSSVSSSHQLSFTDTTADDLICGPVGSFAEDSPIRGGGSSSSYYYHPTTFHNNTNPNTDIDDPNKNNVTAGTVDHDDLFAKWVPHVHGGYSSTILRPSSRSNLMLGKNNNNEQHERTIVTTTLPKNNTSTTATSNVTTVITEWKDLLRETDDEVHNGDDDDDDIILNDHDVDDHSVDMLLSPRKRNNKKKPSTMSTSSIHRANTKSQDVFRTDTATSIHDVFHSPTIYRNNSDNDDSWKRQQLSHQRSQQRHVKQERQYQHIFSPNFKLEALSGESMNDDGNEKLMVDDVAVSSPLAPSSTNTKCSASTGIGNTLSPPNPSLYTDYPDLATKLRFDEGTPLYDHNDDVDDDDDVMDHVNNVDQHDFVFSPPHLQHQQPLLSSSPPPPPPQFGDELLLEGVRRSPLQSSSERKQQVQPTSNTTDAGVGTSTTTPKTKKSSALMKQAYSNDTTTTKKRSNSTSARNKKKNESHAAIFSSGGSSNSSSMRRMTMGEPQSSRSLADINNMMRRGTSDTSRTKQSPPSSTLEPRTTPIKRKLSAAVISAPKVALSKARTKSPLTIKNIAEHQKIVQSKGVSNKKESIRGSQLVAPEAKIQPPSKVAAIETGERIAETKHCQQQQQYGYPYGYQYSMPSQHYSHSNKSAIPPPPSPYQYHQYYDNYPRDAGRRPIHATIPSSHNYPPLPRQATINTPAPTSLNASPQVQLPTSSSRPTVYAADGSAAKMAKTMGTSLPTSGGSSSVPATPRFQGLNPYNNSGGRPPPSTSHTTSSSEQSLYGNSSSRPSHPHPPYGWPISAPSSSLSSSSHFMSPPLRTGALLLPTSRPIHRLSSSGKENNKGGGGKSTTSTLARKSSKRNACNCKKSRCLKLYCECFSAQIFCDECNCVDCCNTQHHLEIREKAMKELLHKNKTAFDVKTPGGGDGAQSIGCKCRRSECLKKYCECFQAGIVCTDGCKCTSCANRAGSQKLIDKRRKMKDTKGAEYAMQISKEIWEQPRRALVVQKPPLITSGEASSSSSLHHRPVSSNFYSRQAELSNVSTGTTSFSPVIKMNARECRGDQPPLTTPAAPPVCTELESSLTGTKGELISKITVAVTESVNKKVMELETSERPSTPDGVRRLSFDSTTSLKANKKHKNNNETLQTFCSDTTAFFGSSASNLPAQSVVEIFRCLSESDLLCVGQVCTQWRDFVNRKYLVKDEDKMIITRDKAL